MADASEPDGLPSMPSRPELPDAAPSRRQGAGIGIALFSALFLFLILGTSFLISPGFTIVIGLIVMVILMHYILWGWWLGRIIRDEDTDVD